jgi:hypothetical protein
MHIVVIGVRFVALTASPGDRPAGVGSGEHVSTVGVESGFAACRILGRNCDLVSPRLTARPAYTGLAVGRLH